MFEYESTVRLRETDAGGVMFFARRFDLMHDAYEAFMEARGLSIAKILADGAYMLPVVHAECDYSAPLATGDVVRVHVEVEEVRTRRFTMRYTVEGAGRAAGTGRTVHVAVDMQTRRAVPLPLEVCEVLKGGAAS
jgi:1,4-dihydroxy-2-naphthoyl-CoA hydrolase